MTKKKKMPNPFILAILCLGLESSRVAYAIEWKVGPKSLSIPSAVNKGTDLAESVLPCIKKLQSNPNNTPIKAMKTGDND